MKRRQYYRDLTGTHPDVWLAPWPAMHAQSLYLLFTPHLVGRPVADILDPFDESPRRSYAV